VDEVEAPDEVATLPSVARVLASINAPAEEGEEEDEVSFPLNRGGFRYVAGWPGVILA
jgi:hypothetical protein